MPVLIGSIQLAADHFSGLSLDRIAKLGARLVPRQREVHLAHGPAFLRVLERVYRSVAQATTGLHPITEELDGTLVD
jgi:ferric-dicitrate binding protein FerR (iron transport regulator)